MDWCRLSTSYYLDAALLRAGEAAEVLFLRCVAYAGAQETGGRIAKAALPQLAPTRTRARVDALVREQLLVDDGDDVLIRSWDVWQEALDSESERRRKAREKKRRQRAAERDSEGPVTVSVPTAVPGTEGDASRGRPRHIEVEVEVEIDPAGTSPPPSPSVPPASGGGEHPAATVRAARSAAGLAVDGWTDTACQAAVLAVKDAAQQRHATQDDAWAALAVVARMPDTSHPGRLTHKLHDALDEVARMRRDAGNARVDAAVLTELAEARARAVDPSEVPAWREAKAALAARAQKRASA